MRIAALTCRSFYSLLRASVSVQRWVERAAEYGYGAVALADVNSLAGVVDLYKTAQSVDVQPIVGVEILTDSQRAVLLAENQAGYGNLCRIITACNLNRDFDLVKELQSDSRGVLCICNQSALLKRLRPILDKEHLFAGCSSPCDMTFAAAHDLEPVAWNNAAWLDNNDMEIAKTLARIRSLSVVGAGPDDSYGVGTLPSVAQVKERFSNYPRALTNADEIVERCNFQLLTGKPILPQAKLAHGTSSAKELAKLCHRGLAQQYRPVSKEIVKRLEYELTTVEKNRFCDYFLVVYEIVNFAKQHGIPVEVRGSAAGSLVSHVLGFTRVCPIENKLYFERFMNPGRTDCPDIDIDLCWRRRDDVIRFCYEHWGFDHVAMVCNVNRYRRRGAIRDAGRALGLTPVEINQLSRAGKIKRDSPVYRLAEQLVGIPRHLGVHCGGIVVTPGPVSRVAPLERANKGVIITQYDKDAAEAVGLVKIDLLGNRSLSTVNEAIEIISRTRNGTGDVSFEPNDSKTARMLSEGDSLGVFQSESPGMRQLLRGLKVKSKKDLAIALSLIRPGPASGGMKAAFIERHVHGKPFEYLHPKLADLLGDTYGVMLYQEDVMRIAVEIAGYTVADADRFRSEVSKKVSAARLQAQYLDFVRSRAEQAGIDRQTAETIWEEILRFAAYSYCKAHATVYGNIAWETAYLKANYPTEFYCSLLNNHHGMYPLRVYVWDAKRHGITVLPPHVNHSEIEWSVQGRAIRAGLNVLKGLSHTTAENVVRERRARGFDDIDDLRRRVTFRRPELQNLIHVGACDGLAATRPLMLSRLHFGRRDLDQPLLFDIYRDCAIGRLPDYDRIARLKAELDTTGMSFSLHPATLLSGRYLPAIKLAKAHHGVSLLGRRATVAGFVAAARKARTSDGRVMGFVTLEDATGLAEVSFFPDQIRLYQGICSYGGPVWVRGKVTEHLSSIAVECIECGKVA
ncbi:MAG: DNA polymerase III subunit alpha [Sedimentisphaerales bacterium]|nr:DNA polymerase III subunit alpha [Sedimentisphaerales bacterium]